MNSSGGRGPRRPAIIVASVPVSVTFLTCTSPPPDSRGHGQTHTQQRRPSTSTPQLSFRHSDFSVRLRPARATPPRLVFWRDLPLAFREPTMSFRSAADVDDLFVTATLLAGPRARTAACDVATHRESRFLAASRQRTHARHKPPPPPGSGAVAFFIKSRERKTTTRPNHAHADALFVVLKQRLCYIAPFNFLSPPAPLPSSVLLLASRSVADVGEHVALLFYTCCSCRCWRWRLRLVRSAFLRDGRAA